MASNRNITPQIGSAACYNAVAAAHSDTVDLADYSSRGLYVGTTGNVKVDMFGSGTVTFTGVPAGTILPIVAKRIYSTGTTASTILVLF